MSRIHDVLNGVEQPRSTHKGNGLEAEAPTLSAEPVSKSRITGIDPSWNLSKEETALAQFPSMNWMPNTKTMLFFGSQEQVSGREQFRTLRSRLYQVRERTSLKKVLVTSSLPKEGRSFTAANLAQVMACQQGCRVLLIDADLRSPSLHQSLGTFATPGLSEYLLGETEEFGIIQRGPMENLFFIASGRPVSGQSELVSNSRLKVLLDRLGPLFDWIVIDSPAAMPVSDSGLIANLCDGVLMVVRSNSTPFDIVRKARERFREEHLLGVVLNGIPAETHLENHYYPDAVETTSKSDGKWAVDREPSSDGRARRTLFQLAAAGAAEIGSLFHSGWPRSARWSRR